LQTSCFSVTASRTPSLSWRAPLCSLPACSSDLPRRTASRLHGRPRNTPPCQHRPLTPYSTMGRPRHAVRPPRRTEARWLSGCGVPATRLLNDGTCASCSDDSSASCTACAPRAGARLRRACTNPTPTIHLSANSHLPLPQGAGRRHSADARRSTSLAPRAALPSAVHAGTSAGAPSRRSCARPASGPYMHSCAEGYAATCSRGAGRRVQSALMRACLHRAAAPGRAAAARPRRAARRRGAAARRRQARSRCARAWRPSRRPCRLRARGAAGCASAFLSAVKR